MATRLDKFYPRIVSNGQFAVFQMASAAFKVAELNPETFEYELLDAPLMSRDDAISLYEKCRAESDV